MPLSSEQYQAFATECRAKRISSVGQLAVSMSRHASAWEKLLGEPMSRGLRLRCADALRDLTNPGGEDVLQSGDDNDLFDDEVESDTDSVTI